MTHPALAIDIGGTTIKAVVATNTGRVLQRWSVHSPHGGTAVLDSVVELVGRARSQWQARPTTDLSVQKQPLADAVSVTCPGIVDEKTGVAVFSANLGWTDFPLRSALQERLDTPVLLHHDVRAGGYGEFRYGAGAEDSYYIAVGTGISAAYLRAGQLYSPHPWCGEIGQTLIPDPNAPSELKKLEQVCSAKAFATRLQTMEPGLLDEHAGAFEVFTLAKQGHASARRIVESGLDSFAQALASLTYTLGPAQIVIGGGLSKEGPDLLHALEKRLENLVHPMVKPPVALAQLGADSQVLGAAALLFDTYGPKANTDLRNA
ncbi:ROK family protein [Gleimia hominis]|uniref:ROK family protein n=1 Tax=Gleimia hominis TaxID=595468 RepID=UPI000C8069CD|nr:ROK family protein [Gleimia hominis]WIK64952.1 ROK family protein [Gleimia hominis]